MRLVVYDGYHTDWVKALSPCLCLREASPSHIQARKLTDCRPQRTPIPQFLACDILCNDPAVDVGGRAHGRPCRFASDGTADHSTVSGSVDVRVVGLSRLVGQKRPLHHLQSCVVQECRIGPDSGTKDYQIRLISLSVCQNLPDFAIVTLQSGDTDTSHNWDTGICQLSLYVRSKLFVKSGQHMGSHIQDNGLHPAFCQVFCNFQADIASSYHHSPFDIAYGNQIPQRDGVFRGAHKKHIF